MTAPHDLQPGSAGPAAPPVPPRPIHRAPPLLDTATVLVLQDAVRASLRMDRGQDPGWTWSRHAEREFRRAAWGHHVSGLIARHSTQLGLPAQLGDGIAGDADRVALKSLAHAGLLRQVHLRLAATGIPALFVKGLAIEAQTGRQLGERGGGDIDVWVSPHHVVAAVEALGPEWALPDGYPKPGASWAWRHWLRWGSELPLLGPITVDLHWHLHGVRANLPDFAEAWASRTEVIVAGQPVPTLSRLHALAHACRHAETDHWRILRSLVDIHLLLASAENTIVPAGRTIAVVDRSIGLPHGPTATNLSARCWASALEEQRHLGDHATRIEQLPRSAYLKRVLGRFDWHSRRPGHDAMRLLWFLAVAPPHESGRITTASTARGVVTGFGQRITYECRRSRRERPPQIPST